LAPLVERGVPRQKLLRLNAAGPLTLVRRPDVDDQQLRLGASLQMGYFAQHAMDLLDGERTVFQSLEDAFPQAGQGSLRIGGGRNRAKGRSAGLSPHSNIRPG